MSRLRYLFTGCWRVLRARERCLFLFLLSLFICFSFFLFRCILASLKAVLSVRPWVSPLVHWSETPSEIFIIRWLFGIVRKSIVIPTINRNLRCNHLSFVIIIIITIIITVIIIIVLNNAFIVFSPTLSYFFILAKEMF